MASWLADWWWAVLEAPVVWVSIGFLEAFVDWWQD